MRMTVLGSVALVAVLGSGPLDAQIPRDAKPVSGQPAAGKGAIRGVVVSADIGRPVRRVNVTLTGGDTTWSKSAQTDEQGAFEFTDLPAGEFTLLAQKGGFVESSYGQKQPGSGRPGTPIRLLAGQQLKDLSLPIARGGVITGRVLDEVGDPAFGLNVRVYRWVMQSGERTLQAGAAGSTDDRGIYRIPALVPGEYVVGVAPTSFGNVAVRLNGAIEYAKVIEAFEVINGDASYGVRISPRGAPGNAGVPKTGFAPALYPGVGTVPAATTITLGPGEERAGVDFNLQIVPMAQLSGVVVGPSGPVRGAAVQLQETAQPPGFGGKSARTGPDGRFVFEGLPPGQYSLMTRSGPKTLEAGMREAVEFLATVKEDGKVTQVSRAINEAAQMWASADVAIDGRDRTDVQLVLQNGLTISGRVTVDTGPEPVLTRMTLGFSPVGAQKADQNAMAAAAVDQTGRFSIKGVTPGRYRLVAMAGMPAGYSIASATFGGQDILDIPLHITGAPSVGEGVVTLTTKTTDVSGHIQNAAGAAASGVTVLVYPVDERLWVPEARRIQAARPATDGRYQFRNLPPGDYRLIAVSDIEPGGWFDPAVLRQLAGFATFSLSPGGKHVQDFRLK